jgi:hypothetical protein
LDAEDIAIPLNLVLIYFGGVGVFGGGLFACVGAVQRWRTPNARSKLLVDAVWTTVSIALIVSIGSFLVLTYTECMEICNLNLTGYYASFYGGFLVAIAGLAAIIVGRLRRKQTMGQ